jgi:hypothetical protein
VLQRSCGRLVILTTSREGLGIDGERLVPVPPLVLPGAGADLDSIIDAEAVRLFTDRAAAVKPGFAVTAENAAAVAAVSRRLDGIALAIELAAARVPAMTPAELARRLDRRFAVLAGGRRGAVERHQTLRAAIDWSFDLLTGAEQALLGRLTVFAGGCTLEAAEAVCGGDRIDPGAVFGLLASLVARSLVVAEKTGPRPATGCWRRSASTARNASMGSARPNGGGPPHAYYADFLRQVRDHGRDPGDGAFWAVRLGAERDNLLAAWSWVTGTGDVDTAFSILAGFAPCEIWTSYPLLLPGNAALELPGATEHPGYPLALAVSAMFASNRADVTGAEELCRQAEEASARRGTPDWRVAVTVCATRSNIASATGAFTAPPASPSKPPASPGGGDLADASVELTIAAVDHRLAGDAPQRSRWPARHSLARQAGRPSSRPACSPWPRRSPKPTPARPAPTCAKAASSARHSATRTPSTSSGRPGSRCRSATGPPRSSLAAAPSAPCSETVTAAGWAASCT